MRNDSPRRSPGTTRSTGSKPKPSRPASNRSSTTKPSWSHKPKRQSDNSGAPRGQGNTRSNDTSGSQRPAKRIISPGKKSVMFSSSVPGAESIAVVGEFNNWEPQQMERGNDGTWRITVQLAHGTYAYRFLVDGEWMQDANNPRRQPNDVGGYDSVCNVL